MTETWYKENNDVEISELFVGRRIVAAEQGEFSIDDRYWSFGAKPQGRLTLDDGAFVYVLPNVGGCNCGAGDYELTSLAKVDNIITSVRLAEDQAERTSRYEEVDTSYRIYVVADAVEINAVQIDGNDGNGYYGSGYELIVVRSNEEATR